MIDPAHVVIDAHHHLYERPGITYLLDDYLADARGLNIQASVYVQARSEYSSMGPSQMRPVGETKFANEIAIKSSKTTLSACVGIVGFADLTLGDLVQPVLEAHVVAGGSRFRGIRHIVSWDRDARLLNPAYPTSEDLMNQPDFRSGFSHLSKLGLSFDVWALFPQLERVARLAKAFPDTRFVINHCGGIVRINDYAQRSDVFEIWRKGIATLARCENVSIKLSGLGMKQCGFGFETWQAPPTSQDLAKAWRPWVMTCLELFGTERCMWGSNFPVDKASYAFGTGLNAFKTLMADASAEERDDVFWRTAKSFYRLP